MSQSNVGWVSDSVTQQIQEHSPKYSGGAVMSGYATLTQPTSGLLINALPNPALPPINRFELAPGRLRPKPASKVRSRKELSPRFY